MPTTKTTEMIAYSIAVIDWFVPSVLFPTHYFISQVEAFQREINQ